MTTQTQNVSNTGSNRTDDDDDDTSTFDASSLSGLESSIDQFNNPTPLENFVSRSSLNYDAANLGTTPKPAIWSGPSVGALSPDSQQRIKQVIQAARSIYGNNDVMVRLTVSQALLESGARLNSGLAVQGNNFFGIKGEGSSGTIVMPTHEYVNGQTITINAAFARNATPEDSFLQHKRLLERPRYQGVLSAADQGNFDLAARAIQDSGYATDPSYAAQLIAINDRIVSPLMASDPTIASNGPTVATHPPYRQLAQNNENPLPSVQQASGMQQIGSKIKSLFNI